jgi:hypothetical protein
MACCPTVVMTLMRHIRLAACLLAVSLAGAHAQTPCGDGDFRIGERLAGSGAQREASYQDITWDDLLPKDWNPMAAFKGIDFSASRTMTREPPRRWRRSSGPGTRPPSALRCRGSGSGCRAS